MSVHVALILLAVLSVAGQLFYLRARYRAKKIAELTSATNILASWPYTADQWRQASEAEFTWARGRGGAGRVYISPDTVYVKGDARERLIDLAGDGRVVTHASYGGGDMGFLKLRVRRKVVRQDRGGADEAKYYKDDYRIPVPAAHRGDALRVVDFFNARIEKNPEAYAETVSDDEPLSLFGDDRF